jgi:hypothetical protein
MLGSSDYTTPNLVTQLLSFHMGMERRYATFKTEIIC